jgi:hypothetical protein
LCFYSVSGFFTAQLRHLGGNVQCLT